MATHLAKILYPKEGYVGISVAATNPNDPKSGDPVRLKTLVGGALTDEQYGYGQPVGPRAVLGGLSVNLPYDAVHNRDYADGNTSISFQGNCWDWEVAKIGSGDAVPGDDVFYHDTPEGGSHLVVNGASAPDAYAGILMDTVTTATKARVWVMLAPGGRGGVVKPT